MPDGPAHAEPIAEIFPNLQSDGDSLSLGSALGPVLREVCRERLGPIDWFRSTWQRSGAATGFSTWKGPEGVERRVVVKLPVSPKEYSWTLRLGAVDAEAWDADEALERSTPRVVAAGEALGGYDLAWLVVERLDGNPISSRLNHENLRGLIGAIADFQFRAARVRPVTETPDHPDWERLIAKARQLVPECGIAQPQRWASALKHVSKVLDRLVDAWRARPTGTWCHGDAHPGNAMLRPLPDGSERCVLIDLGLVHPGHWIEDALYLERLFWGHEDKLFGVDPLHALAEARKAAGLPTAGDVERLGAIRRVLMAACVPVFLAREGSARYVEAALERLEAGLSRAEKGF